jgi:hypothetical protein
MEPSLLERRAILSLGYRSLRNLAAIVYLIAGKIDLKLAT